MCVFISSGKRRRGDVLHRQHAGFGHVTDREQPYLAPCVCVGQRRLIATLLAHGCPLKIKRYISSHTYAYNRPSTVPRAQSFITDHSHCLPTRCTDSRGCSWRQLGCLESQGDGGKRRCTRRLGCKMGTRYDAKRGKRRCTMSLGCK